MFYKFYYAGARSGQVSRHVFVRSPRTINASTLRVAYWLPWPVRVAYGWTVVELKKVISELKLDKTEITLAMNPYYH